MLLDEKVDHGPLLAQEKVTIEPTDTADTLYIRLFTIGSDLLAKSLRNYLDNSLTPQLQDDTQATYTKTLTKQDGFIDLASSPDPIKLQLMIHAFYPWPGVWTKMTLYGKEKIVKLLPNNMLQVEGKKPMTAKDFLNGYPETKTILETCKLL